MKVNKILATLFFLFTSSLTTIAKEIMWYNGVHPVSYSVNAKQSDVVKIALDMFESDMKAVTGKPIKEKKNASIAIYQLDNLSNKEFSALKKLNVPINNIITKPDAFYIGVRNRQIIVVGSNGRGTAYGILELSRLAGVSPWIWWGDVRPEHREYLLLDEEYETLQYPSVTYRGISINDEDWSTQKWSRNIDAHGTKGSIGPKTYGRIFRLLLRLRANTIWSTTHEGTKSFHQVRENKEVADSFDIYIGEQNCIRNKKQVECHWTERMDEKKDDVTLMWRDDNYGYITRLSDSLQQQRSGGAGVYYHLSYEGYPHDYLWLSTTQPGLIYNEMRKAYDHNARKIWIANVHDIKVAAYDLSLFLDMAWNINYVSSNTIDAHLGNWLVQQFGRETGKRLLPVMIRYYYLTGVRKPEFMGWNQVDTQGNFSPVINTDFNPTAFGNELERYLLDYRKLCNKVEEIEETIRPELKDAYFAAITYPVNMATAMAEKQLQAQEARTIAREGEFLRDEDAMSAGANSIKAYRKIKELTDYYNNELAAGKWKGLMNDSPRNLPVFQQPFLPDSLTDEQIEQYADPTYNCTSLKSSKKGIVAHNACDYAEASSEVSTVGMLGHSMKAVSMPKGTILGYKFTVPDKGEYLLRVALIPTQANDTDDIRFEATIDGETTQVFSLKEPFLSEQWKLNVLRGQAVKTMPIKLGKGSHTLTIRALDDNILLDQWMIDNNPTRSFYLFPISPVL